MDSENKIVYRPNHAIPSANGERLKYRDHANLDTKIITSTFGKVPDSGLESLNVYPVSHTTHANKMQHNSKWVAEKTKTFDLSEARELLSASQQCILDCLNCKRFPEASPWKWIELEGFIQVAKDAIVCIAIAYQADARELILSVDSPGDMYWVQLFRKIDERNNAKVKRTRQSDYPSTIDECKEVLDGHIQKSEMLRRESDDVKAIRNWRDNEYHVAAKPSLKQGKLEKIARRLVDLSSVSDNVSPHEAKPLTDNEVGLLEAMLRMNLSVDSLASRETILREAKWTAEGKHAFDKLKDYGYVAAKKSVGFYLTKDGIDRAKKLGQRT